MTLTKSNSAPSTSGPYPGADAANTAATPGAWCRDGNGGDAHGMWCVFRAGLRVPRPCVTCRASPVVKDFMCLRLLAPSGYPSLGGGGALCAPFWRAALWEEGAGGLHVPLPRPSSACVRVSNWTCRQWTSLGGRWTLEAQCCRTSAHQSLDLWLRNDPEMDIPGTTEPAPRPLPQPNLPFWHGV